MLDRFRYARLSWLVMPLALVGCAVGSPSSTGTSNSRGSVSVELRSAHGTAMSQVGYQLSDNDDHHGGSLPPSGPGNIAGVPAGGGYSLSVVGTTNNGLFCQGSLSFNVGAGQTTGTAIPMYCGGHLDGFFDNLGHFFQCPVLGGAFAFPKHASVGGAIFVAAPPVLFRQETYAWSASGGGSFDDPTARITRFTCATAGNQTLTVTITDSYGCNKSLSLDVSCGQAPPTPVCGNGVVEAGEQCDDGNTVSGDGCSADCMVESPTAFCGNGVVEAGEQCDDGNTVSGDGCSSTCQIETPQSVCGNGVVEPGETCDGNCPTTCDDGNACTTDTLTGSPDQCNVECGNAPITACVNGDGCCAPGCTPANDTDCFPDCGNGVVETGETCDGNCPTSCDDGNACTVDQLTGSASQCNAQCTHTAIKSCIDNDGCCAPGCDATNDNDCGATCGNGVVETGETCDGNCPTTCDDGNACTTDTLTGSASRCDAKCTSTPITACISGDGCCAPGCNATNDSDCSASCGNGVVETGETCDGNCPTSCDDGNACTTDHLTGSASQCNVQCTNTPITACISGDGCCAPGCNATNDSDCAPKCGNGIIESGEVCDGNCPTSCNDGDACTTDQLTGSAATCDAVCTSSPITACANDDGCCPAGCTTANDNDCQPECGNGVVDPGETCDGNCPTSCNDGDVCTTDSLTGSASTCDAACTNTPITACIDDDGCCAPGCDATNDNDCAPLCGNGIVEPGEQCDDGNTVSGDGCSAACQTEPSCGPEATLSADVQPILDAHCTTCHTDALAATFGNLSLQAGSSYSNLVGVPSGECTNGSLRVDPMNPDGSYLIDKLTGANLCAGSAQMPLGGTPLAQSDIDTIRSWICYGAQDN